MLTKNMPEEYTATIKWFNRGNGYGFANIDGIEQDIIVHHSVIEMEGYKYVNKDQEVIIEGIEETNDGLRAMKVILL